MGKAILPPFKIKAVEPIRLISREKRLAAIKRVGYNPFLLRSDEVYIDLLTDSGTGAMSDRQWAGIMMGDESYAGSRNFENMQKAVEDIMGFPFVMPAHQGRGAEKVLDRVLIKKGQCVPGNMHFDTTKAHIEDAGGRACDCTIDEAYEVDSDHPFKGNVDLEKLKDCIDDDVAYVLITVTCNSAGGQPVSMENIRAVSELCKKMGLLLFIDAARFAENACFIKMREKGYEDKSIREIVKEMFSYADGCTMSSKKDAIVNMGGFIALQDEELYKKLAPVNVLFEGFPTYGGLNGRDMEALAIGLYEGTELPYLRHRLAQVKYLGDQLMKAGIPVVTPIGGHAVYIDARGFLPDVPQERFPAHTLCNEIYIEGGVRPVGIGTLLAGRNPDSGENILPALELVRLTIPRRVYTKEHLDYVVDVIKAVHKRRDGIMGLVFDYEAPILRHFQSTFKPVELVTERFL